MPEKRPFDHNGSTDSDNKRPRSNNASPAPNGKPDLSAAIAAAKARAAAAAAKFKKPVQISKSTGAPAVQSPIEIARARAAALAQKAAETSAAASQTPKPSAGERARAKAEELSRRRATEALNEPTQSLGERRHNESFEQYAARMRGGLGVGLHPSLMSQDQRESKPEPPQQKSQARQPRRQERRQRTPSTEPPPAKHNPYIAEPPGEDEEPLVTSRPARPLVFVPHGKYIEDAARQRRQAQLELMRDMLAAKADSKDEQLGPEKAFLIDAPPDVEWWDEGLLDTKEYGDLDTPSQIKLDGPDSLITNYILHPVQIQPPQDKNAPPPKPMFLTKKETAKLRRQRRKVELKEEQAKIRLGLVEPPAPKVKKSNLMRVLGESAVQDPTAVEARVNREIAERLAKHEEANHARMLTKEEKAEKLLKRQQGDAAQGIHMNVYRVDNLSYGKHRYQIDVNAKEHALTGICVMYPEMNVVIVEGGERALELYKKIMLRRIRWHENLYKPRADEDEVDEEATAQKSRQPEFLSQFDQNGGLKDLSANSCALVWEGETKQRMFKQWRGMRACEKEQEAKDLLARFKLENMWAMAKTFDASGQQPLWTFNPAANIAKVDDEYGF